MAGNPKGGVTTSPLRCSTEDPHARSVVARELKESSQVTTMSTGVLIGFLGPNARIHGESTFVSLQIFVHRVQI